MILIDICLACKISKLLKQILINCLVWQSHDPVLMAIITPKK